MTLRLTQPADVIILEVSDDGIGFDVLGSTPNHLGLRTMRERAQRAQGTFFIESTHGKGTRIEVRMPTGEPSFKHGS